MIVYMMVGLPGSGKSTERLKLIQKHYDEDMFILSTDDYIESKAEEEILTYKEAFVKYIDEATKAFNRECKSIKDGVETPDVVIVDQTNLSVKTRRQKLEKLGAFREGVKRVAIVVTRDSDKLRLVNEERKQIGRDIPENVLKSMIENFELVSYAGEPFHEVQYINNGY